MLSLKRLITNTPNDVKQRAKLSESDVRAVKMVKGKSGESGVHFTVRAKTHTEEIYYITIIELYPTEREAGVFAKPTLDSAAWVQCSCPFFLFNCEYALSRVGSSDLKYSNGKSPKIKNPSQLPFICKHLIASVPAVVKEITNLAKQNKKTFV